MSGELHALERMIEGVKEELSELKGDVKDLVRASGELIRLAGEAKRQEDALKRIGRVVDDHATRLRTVEITISTNHVGVSTRVGTMERFFWLLLTAIVGAISYFK